MANLIPNEFARNEGLTRGNLTGLSSSGSMLMAEERKLGKIPTGHADNNKVMDVNGAFEELKKGRHIFAKTPDGREIEIKSLGDLKNLNLSDPTAGMGSQNRSYNNYASYYNSFTPFWWPKMNGSSVAPDGSHLDYNRFAPFGPPAPRFGVPGGWSPYAFNG